MRCGDLSRIVLKHVRVSPLQDSRRPAAETRCMLSQIGTAPTGFNSNQLHLLVGKEFIDDPHRIRASSHAGNYSVREPACLLQDLLAGFTADAAMKIANHYRIGVSSEDRPEQVV